jgi:hypothetical protein
MLTLVLVNVTHHAFAIYFRLFLCGRVSCESVSLSIVRLSPSSAVWLVRLFAGADISESIEVGTVKKERKKMPIVLFVGSH